MRILLLIRYFDFGGAENHVCELANQLNAAGHKVFVASRKGRQLQFLNPEITHYTINFSSKKAIFHFFRLLQIVKRHNIEVIHAHQRLPLTIASALSRVVRIPVVATVHNMLREDARKNWVKRGFNRVITVSSNSFKGAQNDPILKSKSLCIPNGIILPSKIITSQPHELHFYYISRLDLRHCKLLEFLFKDAWPAVVDKYPEAKLSIVGDGKGMTEIRRMLEEIKNDVVKNSIFLRGYSSDIQNAISDASLVFGVGRVAMESMASGVPVLSIKNNRLGPIITRENFELMKYGNFIDVESAAPTQEKFMSHISDFVEKQSFYKQETIELSSLISETFNMETIIQSTIKVYLEAAS